MSEPVPKMPAGGVVADGQVTQAGHAFLEGLANKVEEIDGVLNADNGDDGPTLGALASKDTVERTDLATGFGSIVLQRVVVASTSAVVQTTVSVPNDDTIPQNTEGNEVLSGSFTPVSSTSTLFIEVVLTTIGNSVGALQMCAALFKNTGADAIAAVFERPSTALGMTIRLNHVMASPGTDPITFAARLGHCGSSTPTMGLHTSDGTNRLGGGSLVSSITVTEIEAH